MRRSSRGPRRGWPLRRYLLWLITVSVMAAAAAVTYGWVAAYRDALAGAGQDAAFGARLAAGEVADSLVSIREAVAGLAANPGIGAAMAAPRTCSLELRLSGGADAGHLDLIRSDGVVTCTSRQTGGPHQWGSYATAPWWPGLSRGPALLAPVVDTRTGHPSILLSAPVPGSGVIAGFVDLTVLGQVLADQYGGPRHLAFLLTTVDGTTVLARSAGPARSTGPHRRADVPGVGWRLYANADRAAALATARRVATRQTLIVVAGWLIAVLAAFVVHRRITRPIRQLSAVMHASAPEGPAAAALPAKGPAEVMTLSDEFAALTGAVRHELAERRTAEQNYRDLFDHNPYPICLLDLQTLAILDVNDAAAAHYGYSRAEFQSLHLSDLHLPEDVAGVRQALATAVGVARTGPVRHVRKDGAVIDVTITSHALTFNGRPARCAVIEDVTEKENLERRLRQSQRLESLGQLAGGIAHDFNNLLGIIAGYTSVAADGIRGAALTDPRWQPFDEDMTQVTKAVDRATVLTRQLLSFARREVVRPQVVNVNAIVSDLEPLLRRTIGDDIELRVELGADLPPVVADPGQLEQVVLNLVVNARDALPTGGVLTVATSATSTEGRYARLRVSDNGTGMSRDTIDRAFEPFFTTKPKGQGTGLGLATIYGIVTAAGGQAHIDSAVGAGTTVTVLLPATEDVVADPVDSSGEQPPPANGETVLVVEDEESLRALTERVLTRHGYKVLAAADGEQALQVATGHPGHLDLLLTDVVMPHMPGHELAQRLRAEYPDLPVIYMSGYAEPILTDQKTLPPGVTLLTKPIPEHLLLATVRDALNPNAPR